MRRLWIPCLLLLAVALPAAAQDDNDHRFEIAGGYFYGRFSFSPRINMNGWFFQSFVNVSRHASLGGEVDGLYRNVGGVDISDYLFVFGPRVRLSESERFDPYIQGLFGASRVNIGSGGSSVSDTGFAMKIGGGLNISAGRRVSIKVVELNYILTRHFTVDEPPGSQGANNQNHFGVQTGIVIKLGTP